MYLYPKVIKSEKTLKVKKQEIDKNFVVNINNYKNDYWLYEILLTNIDEFSVNKNKQTQKVITSYIIARQYMSSLYINNKFENI